MKKLSIVLCICAANALFASQTNLNPVVVTALKSSQSLKSVTSNINIITSEDIKERDFVTLVEALSTVSGIRVLQNGGIGQSSSVKIRGFDSKRVLVLIDGVRYNDPTGLSGADFSHILLDNVDKIEIIKGPMSGIWGADASAGVINIITKKAEKDGLLASVYGEYGSFNSKKFGLNSAFKKSGFSLSFDIEKLKSDGFSAKAPKGKSVDDFEKDGYENLSANLKIGYDITDRDKIEGSYDYIDSTTEYDGYNIDETASANDDKSKVDSKEKFYNINYLHTAATSSLKIYANRSKFKREYATGFSKSFIGSVDEVGVNSKIDYTKGGFVSFGIDHKKFKHKNAINSSYKNDGIFLTNSNEFSGLIEGTSIAVQSLRYDKFDSFNNRFTYKVGLKHIHEKIEGLQSSFNFATAYNVPTLYQLYDSYAGNKNLNSEKTKGWDLSLNYKGAQITYFDNSVDDMIDYDLAVSKYANIAGKSKLKGVEFSYKNNIEAINLAYSFNYTYLDAKDKDKKRLPRRAKNSANMAIDYYADENLHLGLLAKYLGKRKKSQYDANPDKDDPSFVVLNFNADYELKKKLSLYAKIDNLLNKKYQEISGYSTSKRALYLGFRYKLK